MKQCLTVRQRGFVGFAARLADRFAERAAEYDRDNAFPFDNYEEMRKEGFLRMTLPEELGGMGATQEEMLPALERLAMGDGATALAVTMHVSPMGQWSAVWRRTGDPRLRSLLEMAAEDKLVWAAVTSEIGMPNLMTNARTTATKVEGGYLLNGRKSFGTNTSVATHCSTTARYEDPDLGPRLMLFQVGLDSDAVTIHETWDTMGMRATQSNDVEYTNLFVPDEALVHSLPVDHLDARVLETVFAWAMPAFGAVYNGIAVGALKWAKQQAIRRGRVADARVQDTVAECEMLVEASRAVLERHAHEVTSRQMFEQMTVQEGLSRCAFAKYICTNNATEVMRRLVDVVGGAGYTRNLPFERMWRDVQAGPLMPFSNHAARQLIGVTALGIEYAPTTGSNGAGMGMARASN